MMLFWLDIILVIGFDICVIVVFIVRWYKGKDFGILKCIFKSRFIKFISLYKYILKYSILLVLGDYWFI